MGFWVRPLPLVRFRHGIVQVAGVPIGSIFSRTASVEVEDGVSGEAECGARRFALLWKETSACGGVEAVVVEVSRMVDAIVRSESLSRVAASAAGSGEVAELWRLPVSVG